MVDVVPSKKRRAWDTIRAIGETAALGLLFYFLISSFVLQPFRVEQTSMEPTVDPGEYVLVDKLVASFLGYHRGDIVVLRVSGESRVEGVPLAPLIKRIIAMPGDRLEIRDGLVFVNDAQLAEPYLPGGTTTEAGADSEGAVDLIIPEGEIWVMGDHRGSSTDSRVFGPVPLSGVIGHAVLRYWPIESFGTL